MSLDFGRDRRLRKHTEFARAQRLGRRVATHHFTLLVAPQPPPPRPSRLGLVVTRKVGVAVSRNRIKRLCRECFRSCRELLPEGIDLVVIARQGADELNLGQVKAEWLGVERRLRTLAAEVLARTPRADHPGRQGP